MFYDYMQSIWTNYYEDGYPIDVFFIPLTSINNRDYGISLYDNEEYSFTLGDMYDYRYDLSRGDHIGVYDTDSNKVYSQDLFIESYLKAVSSGTFLSPKAKLYLKGLFNSAEMPNNLSYLFTQIGYNIRETIIASVTEYWKAAGSLVSTALLMEGNNNTTCGFDIYNQRANLNAVHLPYFYDVAVTTLNTKRYFSEWESGKSYYIDDLVIGDGYIHECISSGTSGGVAPAWDTTVGNQTADNTVDWVNKEAETNKYDYVFFYYDEYGWRRKCRLDFLSSYDLSGYADQYVYVFYRYNATMISVANYSTFPECINVVAGHFRERLMTPISVIKLDGSALVEDVLSLYGAVSDWNIVHSEAISGKGGRFVLDNNTERNDSILNQIVDTSHALDTIAYKLSAPRAWENEKPYPKGRIIQPTNNNTNKSIFQVTTAGVSNDPVEPDWNTVSSLGNTIVDGTVTWENIGKIEIDSIQY